MYKVNDTHETEIKPLQMPEQVGSAGPNSVAHGSVVVTPHYTSYNY